MHLIVTLFFAVVSGAIWYFLRKKYKEYHLELLPIMLGACTLMWMVDGFFGLFGPDKKFLGIEPYVVDETGHIAEATAQDLVNIYYQGWNDFALGIVTVVAAILIYLIVLLIMDPKHYWRKEKATKNEQ